jgi:ribosomal protein L9
LFGSVTTKDIEENLVQQGAQVDRRQIVLGRQIKMVGEYQIMIKLVGGIKTNIPLVVESDAIEKPKEDAEEEAKA